MSTGAQLAVAGGTLLAFILFDLALAALIRWVRSS